MSKIKVLFVCVHNSARSQMAEAFLKQLGGEEFEVESAGMEPGILNAVVIEVMREIDIDISKNETKSVFELFKKGRSFDFVITVCDAAKAERCPIFPGITKRLNWSFEDPSTFTGTVDEKLAQTRIIRDKIKLEVENFTQRYQQF